MKVSIAPQSFDPWATLADYQRGGDIDGRHGATAVFVGTMRDVNQGDAVRAMTLEHYPGMTEQYLERIARQACERWDLLDVLIVHRVGELTPNDSIVLVAVWSAHRAAAFDGARFLMEELKSRAPFWKKETLDHGSRWVEHNTPG